MADEPVSPQQVIDDAAKALGETPLPVDENASPEESAAGTIQNTSDTQVKPETPSLESPEAIPILPEPIAPSPIAPPPEIPEKPPVEIPVPDTVSQQPIAPVSPDPPPPPIPEPMVKAATESVIVPSGETETQDTQEKKPPQQKKKKSEKGILIATLLFLVFTLPIAIYYITQSPQFAEIRSRAVYPSITPTPIGGGGGGTGSCIIGRVLYTTGACASKGTVTSSFCPLDCGNLCCNRNDSVCCCMGCYPKGTDCSKAPYNCETPPGNCYHYPEEAAPSENSIVCDPDRSKLNTVTFDSDGKIRIHMVNVHADTTVSMTKGGSAASMTKISDGNFETTVTAGTYTIAVRLGNEDTNSVGFILPTSANKCGRYPGPTRDISSYISSLSDSGIKTTSGVDRPYQCWADAIQGQDTDQRGQLDANWDFEDFNVFIGYTDESAVTPTPTDEPTPTPTTPPVVQATPTTAYTDPTATPAEQHQTPTPTRVRLIADTPATPTPTGQPTPKIPVAGEGPGIIGAISVAGSILLLILGLIL